MNDDFELFVFNGAYKISSKMPNNDPRFAPDGIIEKGSESIRKFWNMKNLRRRKNE